MEYLAAGAARTVTGSCHRLDFDGTRILVDCGLFQGPQQVARLNRESFPFDPADLDAVVLTHGHLDHVGRLPKLVADGYGGPIYATAATRAIAEVILRDSAKLQEEDHARAVRKAGAQGDDDVPPPLYDDGDVDAALGRMRTLDLGATVEIGPIRIGLGSAGHILGSAWVDLRGPDARVVVSGDLGNRESSLKRDADPPPACDVVLVETTYGDRRHRSLESTQREFRRVLHRALVRGGNVLIPSFALERTQQVLFELKLALAAEPEAFRHVRVFLDSPMARRMTELYREMANEFRDEVATALERGEEPFTPPNLEVTQTTGESKRINGIDGGAVVIAGSGMMTGGRIVHHLKHNLWRPAASVVVVGYQAEGTLGRALVDGAQSVRLLGDDVSVRASIHTINGFSAHADRDDLLAWLDGTGDAQVVLVHGEAHVMDGFADELGTLGRTVHAPEQGATLRF